MKLHKLFCLFGLLLLLVSCKAYKNVIYLQQPEVLTDLTPRAESGIPEAVVKKGDLLMITLNTVSAEAAIPFNPPIVADVSRAASDPTAMASNQSLMTYLVSVNGEINFPVLGKLKVNGLRKSELEALIRSSVYPRYIREDPMVTVRFINYKVSVLGDVAKSGPISCMNEKISIFEALSSAGDLTLYGRRKVLLIREDSEGNRLTYRIDLTNPRLLQSSFYYLQQNDIVYVEPNTPRRRSSYVGVGESMALGLIGTLISITTFLLTLSK